jgi:DNA mismatch repair protein MSH5
MPYKRRRVEHSSASVTTSSLASRSSARHTSAARNAVSGSPAFSNPAQHKRVSLKFSDSPLSKSDNGGTSSHGRDVLRPRATETDAEIQEREEHDSVNEIMMAVDIKKGGTVGCAYYTAREETLYLMQDLPSGDLAIVDTLKLHIQPTTVIISTRADEELEKHLSKDARAIERGEDDSMSYILLPSIHEAPRLIR